MNRKSFFKTILTGIGTVFALPLFGAESKAKSENKSSLIHPFYHVQSVAYILVIRKEEPGKTFTLIPYPELISCGPQSNCYKDTLERVRGKNCKIYIDVSFLEYNKSSRPKGENKPKNYRKEITFDQFESLLWCGGIPLLELSKRNNPPISKAEETEAFNTPEDNRDVL